jgi:aspartate-semialdehyde dehydrogenase
MGSDVRVGVVGATGALGSEILKVLDKAPWRPDEVVALARASTSVSHVPYGDGQLVVDDVEHEVLEELDLVILALPAGDARPYGEAAVGAGVPVVDASGVFVADGDVPLVVPWINPEALAEVPRQLVALPTAEAALLASVLGPLRRAGLSGRCTATVLVPASTSGRQGIDELSRQVVALFNAGTPPRKVFPTGLAFDLLPQTGPVDDSGFTRRERRVAEEARGLASWPGSVVVTQVGVPVFSGVSATVQLHLDRAVPLELVRQVLSDGGAKFSDDPAPRAVPRPRRVEGHPFAHVGRLRQADDGSVHLWVALDNLRAMATVAVASAAALLGDRVRG